MDYMASDAYLEDSTKIGAATKPAKPIRKKFAVPPVKLACLECRASRTRCDGKTECSNCTNRGKQCVYTQSKRGGSRIRRRRVSIEEGEVSPKFNNDDLNQCRLSVMPEIEEGIFDRSSSEKSGPNPQYQGNFAAPLSLVAPGGGLKQLDFSLEDTDYIFDSIFATHADSMDSGYDSSEHAGALSEGGRQETPIRVYSSNEDILSAYYTYIHAYFPVLPSPEPSQVTDNPDIGIRRAPDAIFSSKSAPDFEPSSPITLAISAILALIPHPDDKNPSSPESVQLRREQAQAFAHSAFESIEVESELLESIIQPGEALSSDPLPVERRPFHPRNPLENESIIALIMLSTYEYAQRGNIAKMRNRAGQAVNAAINLGLHIKGDEEGYYSEANRRVWWMAYIMVCQGSILSNSTPPILLYDPRFTTLGPTFADDPGAWPIFLQSQQAITSATQFVIDLDITLKQSQNTTAIWDRMLELEAIIEPLILAADTWTLSSSPALGLDGGEMLVGQALRGMARIKLNSARIKLHRFCAFSDVPVFTKKHCDLPAAPPLPLPSQTSTPSFSPAPNSAPNCACSNTFSTLPSLSDMTTAPSQTVPFTNFQGGYTNILPYSSHYSAKICLKSAIAIARSFDSLPYPDPVRSLPISGSGGDMGYFPAMPVPGFKAKITTAASEYKIGGNGRTERPPRMIPVFACCAMQSSYALIMLGYKTRAMGFASAPTGSENMKMEGKEKAENPAQKLLAQLREGLDMILGALRNYGCAYEALGGMRDQIEIAAQSVGVSATGSAEVKWS